MPAIELSLAIEQHRDTRADLTVVVEPPPTHEPGCPDTPVGIYVVNRRVFDLVPDKGFHDIKESLIPRLHRSGFKVLSHRSVSSTPRVLDGPWYWAVNQWAIRRAVHGDLKLPGWSDSREHPECLRRKCSQVDPGALLLGPMILGEGVHVMAGATIVGPASIGAGTIVHRGAVVSRSILWNDVTVGADAFVDQSVVRARVEIAPRTEVVAQIWAAPKRVVRPAARSSQSSIRKLASALSSPLQF